MEDTWGSALTTSADSAAANGLHVPARGREGPGSGHGGAEALLNLYSASRHVDRVSRSLGFRRDSYERP